MRLIDSDKLEEFIKNNTCAIGNDKILLTAGDDGRWHKLLDFIPTVYDVDKVEEELKELREFKRKALENEDAYLADMCRVEGYNKALDDFKDRCYERGLRIGKPLTVTNITMIWKQLKVGGANGYSFKTY